MPPGAIRTGISSFVRRRRTNREAVCGEPVLDDEPEQKRIAGLRVDEVSEQDAALLVVSHLPGRPADEAVDRVRVLRLGQRELVAPPPELVASVLEPVRPGGEDLAPARFRHLIDAVAVDDITSVDGIRPQPGAHLDDDDQLVLECDLELLTGGTGHG